MAPLVRIDDPRVDAWLEAPDTALAKQRVMAAFNLQLGNAFGANEHIARYLTLLPTSNYEKPDWMSSKLN